MIEPGTILCTKDGRVFGNAIVLYPLSSDFSEKYKIQTDFGNIVNISEKGIKEYFYIMDKADNPQTVEGWNLAKMSLMFKNLIK